MFFSLYKKLVVPDFSLMDSFVEIASHLSLENPYHFAQSLTDILKRLSRQHLSPVHRIGDT